MVPAAFVIFTSAIATRTVFELVGRRVRRKGSRKQETQSAPSDLPFNLLPLDVIARITEHLRSPPHAQAPGTESGPRDPGAALAATAPSVLVSMLAASPQWDYPEPIRGKPSSLEALQETGRVLWTLLNRSLPSGTAGSDCSPISYPLSIRIPVDLPAWHRQTLERLCQTTSQTNPGRISSVRLCGFSRAADPSSVAETARVLSQASIPISDLSVTERNVIYSPPPPASPESFDPLGIPPSLISLPGISSITLDGPWTSLANLADIARITTLTSLAITNTHVKVVHLNEHYTGPTATAFFRDMEEVLTDTAPRLRSASFANILVRPVAYKSFLSAATQLTQLTLGWFPVPIDAEKGGLWMPPYVGDPDQAAAELDSGLQAVAAGGTLRSLRFAWPNVTLRPGLWLHQMTGLTSLSLAVKISGSDQLSRLSDLRALCHVDLSPRATWDPSPHLASLASLPALTALRLSDMLSLYESSLALLLPLANKLRSLELVRCGPYRAPAFALEHRNELLAIVPRVAPQVWLAQLEDLQFGAQIKPEVDLLRRTERGGAKSRTPGGKALETIGCLTGLRRLSLSRCEFLTGLENRPSEALALLSLRHLTSLTLHSKDELGWPTSLREIRHHSNYEVLPACLHWRIWDRVLNRLPRLQVFNGQPSAPRLFGLTPKRAQVMAAQLALYAVLLIPSGRNDEDGSGSRLGSGGEEGDPGSAPRQVQVRRRGPAGSFLRRVQRVLAEDWQELAVRLAVIARVDTFIDLVRYLRC